MNFTSEDYQNLISTRKKICLSCEHLYSTTKICKKCGCFMPVKWKLMGASCPIEKWKTPYLAKSVLLSKK